MKYILIAILSIFALCAAAVFLVDYCAWLYDRYCRFHIGRWESRERWADSVYKVVLKWSKKTPTVKIKDHTRYLLIDKISGKNRSGSIQSWQNAAVILGLLEKGDRDAANRAVNRFINSDGNWKKPPVTVDSGMLSYALIKASEEPEKIRPAMDYMRELIVSRVGDDGIISYCKDKNEPEKYVDTLGLACPFLALYAKTYGDKKAQRIAFDQLSFYHDKGLLENTQLPNHAVNSKTGIPLGVYGWGRGVAWYVIGLVDTYFEIEDESVSATLRQWIKDCAEDYIKYQRPDGGFGSWLTRSTTYDSSATAALAYFYKCCAFIFADKKYDSVAERAIERLLKVTRITGMIDFCQGDTKGIGIFSEAYGIMPFAQGMALRAVEYKR